MNKHHGRAAANTGWHHRSVLRTLVVAAALAGAMRCGWGAPPPANPSQELGGMSLEELANVQVTSVSKSVEPLRTAPAAIYLITHDDIMRSGATSIPEALRLAPNLEVTQMSASDYVVSARGFGGSPPAQSFSDKLLVLIDGRSVYSPLYSGVYLDAQDVMLQDVDRIEVISGPGATLWGANAMNGVINIITRPAEVTDGTLVSAAAGSMESNAAARYGGRLDDDTAYRFYGMGFHRDALQLASASDAWSKGQAGFRIDRAATDDTTTVQGDVYRATENQLQQADLMIDGANLLGRWQHRFSAQSELQVQAYYDLTERYSPSGDGAFVLRTYDLEMQQSVALGSSHRMVWGAGERVDDYDITNTSTLLFVPPARALTLGNVFAQDTIALTRALSATVGIKMEDDPYSGWSALPDARVAWALDDANQLWAAGSRAIRSPTPFDVDVVEKVGPTVFLTGNSQFQPEKVWAYEVGYRAQPTPASSLSVSMFYNVYDDLRTIEPDSSTTFIPLHWGNLMAGDTYGLELWGNYQVTDWWRLSPGFSTVHKRLHFEPGASGLLGLAQAGDDAAGHGSLTSSMDLGRSVTFDASLRYVSALPDPALPGYYNMNARVGWRALRRLELSLTGSNLLHSRQLQFPAPYGEEISRSVIVQAQWNY
jgi:iron complex outermembrane recepter protein